MLLQALAVIQALCYVVCQIFQHQEERCEHLNYSTNETNVPVLTELTFPCIISFSFHNNLGACEGHTPNLLSKKQTKNQASGAWRLNHALQEYAGYVMKLGLQARLPVMPESMSSTVGHLGASALQLLPPPQTGSQTQAQRPRAVCAFISLFPSLSSELTDS